MIMVSGLRLGLIGNQIASIALPPGLTAAMIGTLPTPYTSQNNRSIAHPNALIAAMSGLGINSKVAIVLPINSPVSPIFKSHSSRLRQAIGQKPAIGRLLI
jgi:hypothetical protein